MTTRNFVWLSTNGGQWSLASNWGDSTDGTSPSLLTPGAQDNVSVAGLSGKHMQTMGGGGAALSATFAGNTLLSGGFAFGALATAPGGGLLQLGAGTSITAGTATIAAGSLLAGQGSVLAVAGGLTLGTTGVAGATLNVTGGASAAVLALLLQDASDSIYVDPASILEVGSAGAGAAGTLTVDAGARLSGQGDADKFGSVANDGTLSAAGGTLSVGALSGTGTLLIGAGATLALNGACGAGQAVSFAGANATLSLNQEAFAPAGTLSGFAFGDAIDVRGSMISSASFTATSGAGGLLTLYYGGQVAARLTLSGSYAGCVFLTASDGAGGTLVSVAQGAPGGSGPSSGTAGPDQYAWIAAGSGSWNQAADWQDLTTGDTPASIAPGAADLITVAADQDSFTIIGGPGNAAAFGLTGEVGLTGAVALGTLAVGQAAGTSFTPGTLDVLAGAAVTAAGAVVADGGVSVSGGGASLAVSGTLVLGGSTQLGVGLPTAALGVSAGGLVQARALVMGGGSGAGLIVDPTGRVEVGAAGQAATGAVTVDAGATLSGNGQLDPFGSIVDNGTILAAGGTLTVGSVSGTGVLAVAAGATLELAAATAATITLAGSADTGGSTLAFTERAMPTGTLSGFVVGDAIDLEGSTLTAAQFSASNTGGTLLLIYGTTVVGRLTLAGSFAGQRFLLTPDGAGGAEIVLTTLTGGGGTGGQTGTDQLAWTSAVSGNWNRSANWTDLATGGTATLPPGAQTPVQVAGPGGIAFQSVSGTGTCASLALTGNTALLGSFTTGQLAIGQAATAAAASVDGGLDLGPATTLTATQGTLASGELLCIGAGALLTMAGTLALGGGPAGTGLGDTLLSVGGRAAVQLGGLTLGGGDTDTVGVDATATLEVGTAGGAAAGVLTVDAGALASGNGTLNAAGSITDNGAIQAQGGTLLLGGVSGAGTLGIGTEATLALAGADSVAIGFAGGGATLVLPGSAQLPTGVIAGFAPGDSIVVAAGVDGVAFQPGAGGVGTLSLSSAGMAAGQLLLSGSFAGDSFSVQPAPAGAVIILSAPDDSGPPAGTVTPDAYRWTGAVGAAWSDAGNWVDVTQGPGIAAVAPGQNDLVSIAGAIGAATIVNGPADAASLSVSGTVSLAGTCAVGALAVSSAAAVLAVGAGSALSAAGASVGGGLAVGGTLSVAGTLSLLTSGMLAVSGQGAAMLGTVVLGGGAIATAATASVEIGGAAGAASGRITVDAGGVLRGAGSAGLSGGLVDQGTIAASGGTLVLGNVSGTGTLLTGPGADLVLTGSVDPGLTADFAGAGTLTLAGTGAPAIADFGNGDAIWLPVAGIDTAAYAVTGPGTGQLSLYGGGQVLARFTLLGDEAGRVFSVAGAAGGGTILTTQPDNTSGQGGPTVTNPTFTTGQITRGDLLDDIAAAFPAVSQADAGALIGNEGIFLDYSNDGLDPAQTVFGGAGGGVGVNVEVVAPLNGVVAGSKGPGSAIAMAAGYSAVLLLGDENLALTDAPLVTNPASPNYGKYVGLGHALLAGNYGADTIAALGDGDTLVGAAGANTVFYAALTNDNSSSSLPVDVYIHGGGNDAIATNYDNAAITTSGGRSTVVLGPANSTVVSYGTDTIACVGTGGNDTITALTAAGRAGDLVFGPSQGLLSFIGGNAPSTVVGTGGEIMMQGGSGNGSLFWVGDGSAEYEGGSGSALIVAGAGYTSVQGGAGAVTVFGGTGSGVFSGGAGSIFVVGAGASTVTAAAGELVFLNGAGAVSISGGAGANVFGGGSTGNDVFQAGAGSETLWGGAGNDQFLAGSGSDILISGGGNDVFSFTNGIAAGVDTIVGFVPGQSTIALHGYGNQTPQVTYAFGDGIINLSGGAKIIVENVSTLGGGSFTFS